MKIHEYQAKTLFADFGIPVPKGEVARTGAEAGVVAERLGGEGGGHPGAAGWSGQCHPVELQSTLLAALTSELIG